MLAVTGGFGGIAGIAARSSWSTTRSDGPAYVEDGDDADGGAQVDAGGVVQLHATGSPASMP